MEAIVYEQYSTPNELKTQKIEKTAPKEVNYKKITNAQHCSKGKARF